MDFDTYRREAEQLYHEYLRLWQAAGGNFPDRLPGRFRWQYERFELILDLTDTQENIARDIEDFKTQILERRTAVLECLRATTRLSVASNQPTRTDKKKKSPEIVISQARDALAVYRQKDDPRLSTASAVFGFTNTHSAGQSSKAEDKVRRYLKHAEKLLNAAGNGTFFEALQAPLAK